MRKIDSQRGQPLYSVKATREIESTAAAALPAHALMQRAGMAVARLAQAVAPHAGHIWIACGPGNNGGDGFEAALRLVEAGKTVSLSWTGRPGGEAVLPADAQRSLSRARAAGLSISDQPPEHFDLGIDALLGLGGRLKPQPDNASPLPAWLLRLRQSRAPVLSIDLPSGLDADTGADTGPAAAAPGPRFCLSLLTLKPGLFTAAGRDLAGEIWFDDLGIGQPVQQPDALLLAADSAGPATRRHAPHASHKSSFGDVAVLGGEPGMSGAALLAARAALHAGAGRVMVALLGEQALRLDAQQIELMFRSPEALDYLTQTVVCGCGGGQAIRAQLPRLLSTARRAVLDADALNAIAADGQLQQLLAARAGRAYASVLTPHPLEAARLLGGTTASVQADRLAAATALAQRFGCVVVLKGSGSVIAGPGRTPAINSSGNALLATAGTGDVLAGMTGARLARGEDAWQAACGAVFEHGRLADDWASRWPGRPLTASLLASGQQHQGDL